MWKCNQWEMCRVLEKYRRCETRRGLWIKKCFKKGFWRKQPLVRASQVVLVVKNTPTNVRDIRCVGLIPGWRRFPWRRHGYPHQYSCLKNIMEREAWRARVHGDHKELDIIEWLSTHTCTAVCRRILNLWTTRKVLNKAIFILYSH